LFRSIIILVVILAIVFGLFLFYEPATAPAAGSSSESPSVAPDAIPTAHFADFTRDAGIDFQHTTGATGEKLLPETMGGGVAFFDADGDGDPDLLFVNGSSRSTAQGSGERSSLVLYRNDGRGQFTDVTGASGLKCDLYGMGVAVGDYDNDGQVDIFVTGVAGCRLFRNAGGGSFADMTVAAGISSGSEDWSTSAAWFDLENDGDLDLFVCQYVRWTPELDRQVDYRLPGIGRAYGPPMNFPGSLPKLYRNDRAGKFTDISTASGIQLRNAATGQPLAKSLGVAPVDLNNDGWIDLVVANDTVQNFVFTNRHDGTFREVGAQSGLAYDPFGATRGAMGIDTARFEDTGALGISIGNFANEMTALYVSKDSLTFADEAIRRGIGTASRMSLTFGVVFFDCDLDGWQDLLTANGHIEPEIQRVHPDQPYRQPAQLFWNARGQRPEGGFALVPASKCGSDLVRPLVGRGSAFADIDGDGDLDVVISQAGGPPLLLRNDQALGHHWVRLRLTGRRSNRDAIGAWVGVRTGSRTQLRQVMPTRGYLSQSELTLTIGLGDAQRVDEITVTWPGGHVQRVTPGPLDELQTIVEAP
jgi:hypothetical protein